MAQVEILKDVSLASLTESIPQQLATIWQSGHQRTQLLILIQRHHRQKFEGHAATLQLKHPCWSLFYRPRAEVGDIEEGGFDPKTASFMFLDVALEDLGKWVGPLAKDEWLREEVIITPSENAEDFTSTKWTMFRDPWLESLDVLPLAKSPHEINAKAWLTSPSATATINSNATEDSAFAGKLADLTHSFGAGMVAPETPAPVVNTPSTPTAVPDTPAFVMPSGPISIPSLGGAPVTIPEPATPVMEEEAPVPSSLSPVPVDAPQKQTKADVDNTITEEIPTAIPTPDEGPKGEGVEIKVELLDTIQLLKAGGLEAEQILESPAFQEVSERATAAGLDVWSIFIENAN
jgi:hypothetical protein